MTNDEIVAIVKEELGGSTLDSSVVYISKEQLAAGDTANVPGQIIRAEKAADLIFVDLQPGANWSHPCVYLLIDTSSGQAHHFNGKLPPAFSNYSLLFKGTKVDSWTVLT
ncbi:MAG: hypothetical protein JWQ38_2652 [Flavipsychrobacter sp.]|nr:hypothetical protein [Flavipsychrobacter sp.]